MYRNRILRKSNAIRELVSEISLSPSDLIYPIFICNDDDLLEISTMPGLCRYTINSAKIEIQKLMSFGVYCFMLFPYIKNEEKDELGSLAIDENNLICRAIFEIKQLIPEAVIMADVALDPYTIHGHDGVLNDAKSDVDNDKTIEVLQKQALIQAKAGADFITPSDMMDGRVAKIRQILDANGLNYTGIISYSAKFASNLYSPFRNAINSGIKSGPMDKKTYQIDPRNTKMALKSINDDVNQGTDGIIIKPAGWYLDIIKSCSEKSNLPIFGYQVSGEYAMICKLADNQEQMLKLAKESLMCIKRSGATGIITYFAKFAEFL